MKKLPFNFLFTIFKKLFPSLHLEPNPPHFQYFVSYFKKYINNKIQNTIANLKDGTHVLRITVFIIFPKDLSYSNNCAVTSRITKVLEKMKKANKSIWGANTIECPLLT